MFLKSRWFARSANRLVDDIIFHNVEICVHVKLSMVCRRFVDILATRFKFHPDPRGTRELSLYPLLLTSVVDPFFFFPLSDNRSLITLSFVIILFLPQLKMYADTNTLARGSRGPRKERSSWARFVVA